MLVNTYVRRPSTGKTLLLHACEKSIGTYNPVAGVPQETLAEATDAARRALEAFPDATLVVVIVFYSRHIVHIERLRNEQLTLPI